MIESWLLFYSDNSDTKLILLIISIIHVFILVSTAVMIHIIAMEEMHEIMYLPR
jgi:hypothetical protein